MRDFRRSHRDATDRCQGCFSTWSKLVDLIFWYCTQVFLPQTMPTGLEWLEDLNEQSGGELPQWSARSHILAINHGAPLDRWGHSATSNWDLLCPDSDSPGFARCFADTGPLSPESSHLQQVVSVIRCTFFRINQLTCFHYTISRNILQCESLRFFHDFSWDFSNIFCPLAKLKCLPLGNSLLPHGHVRDGWRGGRCGEPDSWWQGQVRWETSGMQLVVSVRQWIQKCGVHFLISNVSVNNSVDSPGWVDRSKTKY